MDLDQLTHATLDELEEIYRAAPIGPAPSGLFRGQKLAILPSLRQRPVVRAADWLLFDVPPFGIDFDRRLWWFFTPRLATARFDPTHGPSRWRDTDTYRLDYRPSHLPLATLLYDEAKPLDPDLCLGFGGLNQGPGDGDHFFFALSRLR